LTAFSSHIHILPPIPSLPSLPAPETPPSTTLAIGPLHPHPLTSRNDGNPHNDQQQNKLPKELQDFIDEAKKLVVNVRKPNPNEKVGKEEDPILVY